MSGGKLLRNAWSVVSIVPVAIVVRDCFYDYALAVGVSMQPTLNPYPDEALLKKYFFARYPMDVVLLEKWKVRNHQYEKGSVVILRSPNHPNRLLCKRLVATEGEWVLDKNGEYEHIPKGHCWIEGDNPEDSIDSNDFGPVPLGLITARCSRIVFPPWRWGKIESKDSDSLNRTKKRPYQIEDELKSLGFSEKECKKLLDTAKELNSS
mmetsp:Transcript_3127/g.4497  ORF Transcript_3127/g.4497 Transcript_3127/m.4497 type:complete len:208 (+) Transcript_3127:262-885(+)